MTTSTDHARAAADRADPPQTGWAVADRLHRWWTSPTGRAHRREGRYLAWALWGLLTIALGEAIADSRALARLVILGVSGPAGLCWAFGLWVAARGVPKDWPGTRRRRAAAGQWRPLPLTWRHGLLALWASLPWCLLMTGGVLLWAMLTAQSLTLPLDGPLVIAALTLQGMATGTVTYLRQAVPPQERGSWWGDGEWQEGWQTLEGLWLRVALIGRGRRAHQRAWRVLLTLRAQEYAPSDLPPALGRQLRHIPPHWWKALLLDPAPEWREWAIRTMGAGPSRRDEPT